MKEQAIPEAVKEIVGRHTLPDLIVGLDVRLGEFDGDPAMWLIFRTTPGDQTRTVEHDRRVAEISRLKEALLPDLLNAFDDRFPYFRFESERSLSPTEG